MFTSHIRKLKIEISGFYSATLNISHHQGRKDLFLLFIFGSERAFATVSLIFLIKNSEKALKKSLVGINAVSFVLVRPFLYALWVGYFYGIFCGYPFNPNVKLYKIIFLMNLKQLLLYFFILRF